MFTVAVENDDVEALKSLLAQNPVFVYRHDVGGYTALMYAAEYGSVNAMNFMLDNGAKINAHSVAVNTKMARKYGTDGMTALMIAAQNNQVDAVKLLLERGADPNKTNRDNKTAYQLTTNATIKHLLGG